ncbi:MAG: aminofutalosine synthase MqnE [Nitrospirae bacterium]|nr:aminofutalosine synthase MqnE [Nitrospirota bacterium]
MLDEIKEKVYSGIRLTKKDGIGLFSSDDIFTLGELASYVSKKKNGDKAYFVRNLHVNPTNICVNRCRFCAFSRSKGQKGAFELSIKDILKNIGSALKSQPLHEVHIVGGLHPDWKFGHYLEMLSEIRRNFPLLHIKAFTATEVDYMQRISRLPLKKVLILLKRHGLDSMPGGGAEIFSPAIRKRLCPQKLSGRKWQYVMETAHRIGIKTNATMLYGHIENYGHRVSHLLMLRELQDRTAGFQAFIPLPYQGVRPHANKGTWLTANSNPADDLKTIAVSRIMLDNFPHIKAYWVMLGEKVAQLALLFGADDLDGTVIAEKIAYATGSQSKIGMTVRELVHLIRKAGRIPIERDSFYNEIEKYD